MACVELRVQIKNLSYEFLGLETSKREIEGFNNIKYRQEIIV